MSYQKMSNADSHRLITTLKQEVRDVLTQNILPFWLDKIYIAVSRSMPSTTSTMAISKP